jgi:tetratricopeptide (TPR) repeat protein
MVSLYPSFPRELQRTPVAREQLAFALNRMAEAAAKRGDKAKAHEHRAEARAVVQKIPDAERTSETFGILGRIHKGLADEEEQAGNTAAAQAALSKAIQLYEEGFQRDPRDYYPGVNAVTLRIVRARPEDEAELKHLLPVVRFSVRRAPKPTELRPAEAYWQEATRLELACAERDWEAVPQHTEALLGLKTEPWMQPWMYKTTIGNLEKQRKARATEPDTVQHLEHTIQALS